MDKLGSAVVGGIVGAVAIAVVGFTWWGWTTSGNAETKAELRADRAVVAALTPICVAQFNAQSDAAAKLVALRAAPSYNQGSFVDEGGWATMPGSDKPASGVGQACADVLIKATAS